MHSNSWWMQWGPGAKPQEATCEKNKDENSKDKGNCKNIKSDTLQ